MFLIMRTGQDQKDMISELLLKYQEANFNNSADIDTIEKEVCNIEYDDHFEQLILFEKLDQIQKFKACQELYLKRKNPKKNKVILSDIDKDYLEFQHQYFTSQIPKSLITDEELRHNYLVHLKLDGFQPPMLHFNAILENLVSSLFESILNEEFEISQILVDEIADYL
jgi:hypothetical protein